MRPLRAVTELFPNARDTGLTPGQVIDSTSRFGINRLTAIPRESAWRKFLAKFDDPIIKILLAASLLKIIVDLFDASVIAGSIALGLGLAVLLLAVVRKAGPLLPATMFTLATALVGVSIALGDPSYEGLAVMVAVVLATGVAFLSEYRSDREFEKLNAVRESVRVKLRRDGNILILPIEDIVVGDLVLLEMGDEIPADGRFVRCTELHVDQSLMTGESEPVKKGIALLDDESDRPDDPGCAFRGTQVTEGVGEMIVTNVGDDTLLGQIARRLSTVHETDDVQDVSQSSSTSRVSKKLNLSTSSTPLQEKLAVLARLISKVGYAAAIAIFIALLVRGTLVGEIRLPAADEDTGKVLLASIRALLSYFVYMVIIIVVAVPEGLPMSVTVSLAIAWRKMSKANSLVRQLVACETIGSATVICTDKTGTLTQNKMRVARIGLAATVLDPPAQLPAGSTANSDSPLWWMIVNAAVNSTANLHIKNGKLATVGNITEGALLLWLNAGAWTQNSSIDYAALRAQAPVRNQLLFSSDRKQMTTEAMIEGKLTTLVKGAPEIVLAECEYFRAEDGSVHELDAKSREAIQHQIDLAAADAMRTLAFAHVQHDSANSQEASLQPARGLIFDGWIGIRDPLRADVKQAIHECRTAGIDVKMITGDTIETARAIACEIGLLDSPDAIALSHAEFSRFSDAELTSLLPKLKVLARALPEDKYRLVKLLQAENHVVAMTGDGTNDAPALKRADVGLAMGMAGTEVAKEASKIVLLDDAFSTIVHGVRWGRALYENIQRFIQFQLTINVSALAIAFIAPFFGLKPPFTVLQLLWINVIMDTFAAIALCSEPPHDNLMNRPPKRRDESILTRAMLGNIFGTAAFFFVVMMALLIGMQHGSWFAGEGTMSDDFRPLTVRQVTLFFTIYVFFQVWNQINCRTITPDESSFRGLFHNPQFLVISTLTVIGQILIVNLGGMIFHVEPISLIDWIAIAASTASVLVFAEIVRRIKLWRRT